MAKIPVIIIALLFVWSSFGESIQQTENRTGIQYDETAQGCIQGNEAQCAICSQGPCRARAILPASGGSTGSSDDSSFEKWVTHALSKISGLNLPAPLNGLLQQAQTVLGAMQSSGGLRAAANNPTVTSGIQNLLSSASTFLPAPLISSLQQELPQLAQQVGSGQLGLSGLVQTLTSKYGSDPTIQNLINTFGGGNISGTNIAAVANTFETQEAKLNQILPPHL